MNQKSLLLFGVLGGILVFASYFWMINNDSLNFLQANTQLFTQNDLKRVLITPFDKEKDKTIKTKTEVDIKHEFKDKFTADVPVNLLPMLEEYGEVEDVPVWEVHAKPIKTPAVQTCFPNNQREYNVTQVNGGQAGAGAGVKVALLDSGTYTKHPDLTVQVCKDATKKGIREGCSDNNGHGTHVAGIIAANGGSEGKGLYGVAPEATLLSIKVCGGTYCFTDDIAEGINYAAEQGANIINMSFGGMTESSLVKDAIAAHPEVLFVASAGNSGPNANTIEYPGANPGVVAVAANDSNKVIANFSSRGIDDNDDSSISEREVELTAGGVSVESTDKDGCYSAWSGTSFSSPTIAGLAAKVWQGSASATRSYLRTIVQDLTQADGGGAYEGYDYASGYGLPVSAI